MGREGNEGVPVNNSIDGHLLTARNMPKVNECGMVFADKLMAAKAEPA